MTQSFCVTGFSE
jgi:hypothetical protein